MSETTISKKKTAFVLIAALSGTVLEWYDFMIYAMLAPIISSQFFPAKNAANSLMMTFAVFSVGFLIRPIGAIFFGWLGDRAGRKASLWVSIIFMMVPACLFGFLPTYAQVGALAPVLLIIARLLQGFSVSGEYPGAVALLGESMPQKHRSFFTSLSMVSVVFGILLSSLMSLLVSSMLSKASLYDFGWRIPFFIGIAFSMVALYFRALVMESPVFLALKAKRELSRNPLRAALLKHYRSSLVVLGLFLLGNVSFYIIFIYFPVYIQSQTHLALHSVLSINTINIVIEVGLLALFGYLSDFVNRGLLMRMAIIGFLLLSYPLFRLAVVPSLPHMFFVQLIFGVLIAMFSAPAPSVCVDVFPVACRYTGIALGINLSASFFGGTSPLVSSALVKYTGSASAPAGYLMCCAVLALFAVLNFSAIRRRLSPFDVGMENAYTSEK